MTEIEMPKTDTLPAAKMTGGEAPPAPETPTAPETPGTPSPDIPEPVKASIASAQETVRQGVADLAETAADSLAASSQEAERFRDAARRAVASAMDEMGQALPAPQIDALQAQLRTFVRENPGLALGGAAVLGFVAARVLTASSERS